MTNKEICDCCKKEFIPKKHNEIWSSYSYNEPSSLEYYACDKCLNEQIKQEQEFSRQQEELYNKYGNSEID